MSAPILGIGRGPVGPQGPSGAAGATGATGAAGATGATGSTGATGAAGSNGANGYATLEAFTQPAVDATVSDVSYLGPSPGVGARLDLVDAAPAIVGRYEVTVDAASRLTLKLLSEGTVTAGNPVGATVALHAGPTGPTGATGAAGSAGATGATGATGPTGPSELVFGAAGLLTTNQTAYMAIGDGYNYTVVTTRDFQYTCTGARSFTKIRVARKTAGSAGGTRTFTLRKNGSDTALTVTMNNDAASASADVAAVTFADGDILELVCTTAGSPSNSPSAVIVVIG